MTAKQKVLERWPDAYLAGAYSLSSGNDEFDVVIRSTQKTVGTGRTQAEAWQSAAEGLSDERTN